MVHPERRTPAPPATRIGADGNRHIDMLVLNSTVQAILNLTDTWFVGRLSTAATAAISAVHWLSLLALFLIGGVAMGVQTLVAQAYGAGRYRRTSQIAWMGLWAALLTIPAFILTIVIAPRMFHVFGLPANVESLALDFWGPRMVGGPLAAALWAAVAYFNGIGRTRIPLAIGLVVTLANIALNQVLIFQLGYGIAGAAWATTFAELVGVLLAILMILRLEPLRFRARLTWRPRTGRISALVDAGAHEHHRRRRDADCHGIHVARLHAGHRHCARRHDTGRSGDWRRGPRLG
jgi:MATE family multidrug resistance protein